MAEQTSTRVSLLAEPKDLDELRAWATQWNHLVPIATQTYRLFEELDAANKLLEDRQS